MEHGKSTSFGNFRLDSSNECLWEHTRQIPLRPKAFAVLKLLVERGGQLVTKQQLLDSVWPGTFVGDAVLKDSIRQLREALKDDAASPDYIETAHRRGYRFIGKLSVPVLSSTPSASGTHPLLAETTVKVSALTCSKTPVGVLGRESELAKMRGWLEQALAGARQTVFVTGEPGIGKTTIVQAFLEQAGRIPGVRVARGQC